MVVTGRLYHVVSDLKSTSHVPFDAAVNYCSVWHVDAKRRPRSSEHVLFSAGGKLAWPISPEVKEVD